tara:strand:+ start:92 stop:220 length:129 start_codon:yes stop_codon:yes gene_type:complete
VKDNQKRNFWDNVNKRLYRWHELKLLMQERELKKKKKNGEKN